MINPLLVGPRNSMAPRRPRGRIFQRCVQVSSRRSFRDRHDRDGQEGEQADRSERDRVALVGHECSHQRRDQRGDEVLPGVVHTHRPARPERSAELGDGGERESVAGHRDGGRHDHDRDREAGLLEHAEGDHGHESRHGDDAHRAEPAAHPVGPPADADREPGHRAAGWSRPARRRPPSTSARSSMSQTSMYVHTVSCGMTSSIDARWMRAETRAAAVRVGELAEAFGLLAARTRRVDDQQRDGDRRHGAHHGGYEQGGPQSLRPPR